MIDLLPILPFDSAIVSATLKCLMKFYNITDNVRMLDICPIPQCYRSRQSYLLISISLSFLPLFAIDCVVKIEKPIKINVEMTQNIRAVSLFKFGFCTPGSPEADPSQLHPQRGD